MATRPTDADYKPVQSSNLHSVAWLANQLFVRFKDKSGAVSSEYRYDDVPESVFYGLMAAHSKGEWLNQYVKGQYTFQQIA